MIKDNQIMLGVLQAFKKENEMLIIANTELLIKIDELEKELNTFKDNG